jgi:hypothetical protein
MEKSNDTLVKFPVALAVNSIGKNLFSSTLRGLVILFTIRELLVGVTSIDAYALRFG